MQDAFAVDLPVGEDLGRDRALPARSARATAEVVNSFMFDASGRWRRAARAQTGLPVLGVDDVEAAGLAAATQQSAPQRLCRAPPSPRCGTRNLGRKNRN